jgi:hypothetical protein
MDEVSGIILALIAWILARPKKQAGNKLPVSHCPQLSVHRGVSGMSDFKRGDRVVVLRLDSDEIECHGRYTGETGPIMFVLPDDDDLPDPVEVGADRVFPEKNRRAR